MPHFPDPRDGTRRTSVWTWPMALNALDISGLVSALVSDGWGDARAWGALGSPVALMTWPAVRRR